MFYKGSGGVHLKASCVDYKRKTTLKTCFMLQQRAVLRQVRTGEARASVDQTSTLQHQRRLAIKHFKLLLFHS